MKLMPMRDFTPPAEVRTVAQPTLDEQRQQWRQIDAAETTRKHEFKRQHARRTWALYLIWCTRTAKTNRREFMVWLTGEVDPSTQLYDYLNAGHALERGFDYDLGISWLAYIGRALESHTAEDVQELLESEGAQAVKALVVKQREVGLVKLPAADLPAVRDAIGRVSETEGVSGAQALSLIVQGHDSLPRVEQLGVIEAAKTGAPVGYATGQVVSQLLDPFDWLRSHRCFVPGCLMASEHLHHLKLDEDSRFRSHEIVIPLCRRHHIAEPGFQSVAAHAENQTVWILRFWPDLTAFWRDVTALYALRLFGSEFGYNFTPADEATPLALVSGEN